MEGEPFFSVPNPLETYLTELRRIRSTGAAVKEPSYYPALANLLNEVGKKLKPRVYCFMSLKNQGAGFPDGGLFTADQIQNPPSLEPLPGQMPSRGVIEVKSTSDDAWITASGLQVTRYWGKYRQVLVTNLRDFVLVGQDAAGNPVKLETYRLAVSEAAFWAMAAHPRKPAETHTGPLRDYLIRVLRHGAPLVSPEDVAWFLASYARLAKLRVETASLPALDALRTALEEALGLKFEGPKGEHFFRSTLAQTLFYGIFAAWSLWAKQMLAGRGSAQFDWRWASWSLRVPMIKALFEQIAMPSKLGPLGLEEVLDWTAAMLNRVDAMAFFAQFESGYAVQYFYEPFLRAFDPELKKQLGIWYTPPEIVRYMVARVDAVLRTELGLSDGLADPNVYVLDPCCGTGAYLVEALRRIADTLQSRGGDALVAQDLKRAAMERVFGFEILPAPFVVAHLQLGLLLQGMGVPLSEAQQERAGVYLTNSLTGWEPPKGPKQHLMFPELEQERDAAGEVKRDKPILVIIGNPPYNAYAGVSPKEEEGLLAPYKEGLREWGITKNYLDDMYVRFFRLAERRIAEMTGRGVVSYISNHSWVSDPSFVVLRKRLLDSFDRFWVENMHGNRKISEYAPDGRVSETIFAIPGFSPGIQQGVVISLWAKGVKVHSGPKVLFRDDLNAAKAFERREQLLQSLQVQDFDSVYKPARPTSSNRYSFRPFDVAHGYESWPTVADLAATAPLLGLNDNRKQATSDISRNVLVERMRRYYDPKTPFEELTKLHPGLTTNAAGFNARATRSRLLKESRFHESNVARYWFKPFDLRWAYLEQIGNLWNRVRPELLQHAWAGNEFLLARRHAPKAPDGAVFYFSHHIADQHVLHTDAYFIPLRLRLDSARPRKDGQGFLFKEPRRAFAANLSPMARAYLGSLGITDPDQDTEAAALIWLHAFAIGYAPAYISDNVDGIRLDWPRIPLPASQEMLRESASLGRQVAQILDIEAAFPGVTTGTVRPELKLFAMISRTGGGPLNPGAGDLRVTAGWGYAGKRGIAMPGTGRLEERDYAPEERALLEAWAKTTRLGLREALSLLGKSTCDVYLNVVAYWRNVPEGVWRYTVGGNQVLKKWLSYREAELLGRPLTEDEARQFMQMARRIAAILLLQPLLNANYKANASSAYQWVSPGRAAVLGQLGRLGRRVRQK